MVFFDKSRLDTLSDDELRALERQSVQVATTVDLRNGRMSVTDGPFAETNEQIGGSFD
jgi:hypothetical protein